MANRQPLMKAMLFAAGLGTRLRPLTDNRPKALVEVNGTPLLEIAIRRLIAAGCREVIVNVHHFAEQIIGFLKKNDHFGIRIAISDERETLLETGGGLKKAAWFFDDETPFLVCNTDVLTNLDLQKFYQKHLESGALATLAVRNRPSSRSFLFDEKMHLTGWQNTKTGETRWCNPKYINTQTHKHTPFAFSGIHALNPAIFDRMPDEEQKFSIVETYLQAAASETILGYPHDGDFWFDVGKPEALAKAAEFLKNETTH